MHKPHDFWTTAKLVMNESENNRWCQIFVLISFFVVVAIYAGLSLLLTSAIQGTGTGTFRIL